MSNFTVYKSSAGSGKTFTLVKSYLSLALSDQSNPPVKYKSILAITFTNKAAGEMKERVIDNLRSISENGIDDKMGELLCVELKITSEEVIERAKNLLNAILHNYSEFSIGTIDGFVHRVIRTFALDLRLPLNFTIETDSEVILAKCVDELLKRVGNDEMLTDILLQFAESRVEEDKNWRIETELLEFAKKINKEETPQIANQFNNHEVESLINVKDLMSEFTRSFENELKPRASSVINWINEQGLQVSDFYQGNKGIRNYFNKVKNGNFHDGLINSFIETTLEEDKWKSGGSNLTAEQIDYLKIHFNEMEQIRTAGVEKYLLYKAILGNIYSLMVFRELQVILLKLKQEENFVFISEFNALIAEIIRTEPVPFIYERIGERYKHYLIDEFQDTSILQWNNLLPLIDDSLAAGNSNLVVGDGKQSIYRWRGGDADQFSDLPKIQGKKNEILQQREDSLIRNYHEEILKVNYRSRDEIIGFNNTLYEWLKENKIPERFRKVYKDCSQKGQDGKSGGFISFDYINKEDKTLDRQLMICEKVEAYIKLNCESFGYSFSDITILVRSKNKGKIIADFLLSKNIPIVSSETLLLNNNSSVIFILALLKLIQTERNQLEEAVAIKYLSQFSSQFNNSDYEVLWNDFKSSGKTIWQFLNEHDLINFNREYFASMPLFELCCMLIREMKPQEKDHLFLQFFLDEVIKYTRNNPDNLSSFLDWWKANAHNRSAILPSGSDAVNIMTIHGSKGLQFPVVIIPFADWEINKTDSLWLEVNEPEISDINVAIINSPAMLKDTRYGSIVTDEADKQILDNVNLLYVATTRAEENLHIISINQNRKDYLDSWLREFFEANEQWKKSDAHFEIGLMQNKSGKTKKQKEILGYEMRISENIDLLELKTSGLISTKDQKVFSGVELGVLFHQAMARVFLPSDATKVKSWLLSQSLCDASKAEEIQHKIITLMSNENFNRFFPAGKRSLNEPELITDNGEYRPDRIVFMDDHISILDYKTGEISEEHQSQILNYSNIVSGIFSKKVKNYLIYLQTEEILEVYPN